jgi:hypothetical protein
MKGFRPRYFFLVFFLEAEFEVAGTAVEADVFRYPRGIKRRQIPCRLSVNL